MNQGGPTNDGANEELYSPSAELHALEEDIDIPEEPPLLPRREPLRSIFKGIAVVEQVLGAVLLFVLLGLTIALVLQRRSEEHTSELQSRENLVCRLLLEKKKTT